MEHEKNGAAHWGLTPFFFLDAGGPGGFLPGCCLLAKASQMCYKNQELKGLPPEQVRRSGNAY